MAGYQIVDKKDRRKLAEFLAGEGEVLLPLLGLIETAEVGLNALIDVVGRAGIEACCRRWLSVWGSASRRSVAR